MDIELTQSVNAQSVYIHFAALFKRSSFYEERIHLWRHVFRCLVTRFVAKQIYNVKSYSRLLCRHFLVIFHFVR